MTMQAKFPGRCKKCSEPIEIGETISWTKEDGAAHATCPEPKAKPKADAPPVKLSLASIATFLLAAKSRGLKFPKVRFLSPNNTVLRLHIAGDQSKAPGAIQVRLVDEWIGRIDVDGTVHGPLRDLTEIATELERIAENPAAAAARYGALMGHCSFCGLALNDAGSVEVGYGPICAKKYDLPWERKGVPVLAPLAGA